MSIQKVLVIQDASKELCTISIREALLHLHLLAGSKMKLLRVIDFQAVRTVHIPSLLPCGSLQRNRRQLESSSSINLREEEIQKEIQKKKDECSNCADMAKILKLAEKQQVEFEVAVDIGMMRKIIVEHAKKLDATHVILYRQLKKDQKYFLDNLSCGILRMKHNNSIETIREAKETADMLMPYSNNGTSHRWEQQEGGISCSFCMIQRPVTQGKKDFTYAELQLAMKKFSEQNLLSDQGTKLYRGLLDEQKIRIREHPSTTINKKKFADEVNTLVKIRHESVAMLLGSCSEGQHRLLVYDDSCNGSLEEHLSNKSGDLTWEIRMAIIHETARGLDYLHRNGIYACVKPSNILLTHDYRPLVSDFGLARNQYEELNQSVAAWISGTIHSFPPEYIGPDTDLGKVDVFYFGVLLLELITGRKTLEDTDEKSYLEWARPLLRQKNYRDLVDPLLQESADLHQLYWMVRIADKCLSWNPENRCPMNKLVEIIGRIINCSSIDHFSPTEYELKCITRQI